MHPSHHRSRRHRAGGLILAVGLSVGLAACGSQLTPQEVAAANGGSAQGGTLTGTGTGEIGRAHV